MENTSGQTFIETIIIVSIVAIVITALVSASTASLKVTGFTSLKSQATKYAQEGIELARQERDASWSVFYNRSQPTRTWCLDKAGVWSQQSPCPVNIDNTFTRSIQLSYDGVNQRIEARVIVTWRDGAEIRSSKITTFFTNWR
jgi:type II secretory pathway pseudopilin PulG